MAAKYVVTKKNPFALGSSYKAKCYNVIAAAGQAGADRNEIAAQVGLNAGRVSTYLAELKRDGLVNKLGGQIDITTLDADGAALYAMETMENALVARAKEQWKTGAPPEVNAAFVKYQKIKNLALGAKTKGEERTALKMAFRALVDLVF